MHILFKSIKRICEAYNSASICSDKCMESIFTCAWNIWKENHIMSHLFVYDSGGHMEGWNDILQDKGSLPCGGIHTS